MRRIGSAALDAVVVGVAGLAIGAGISRLGPHSVVVALVAAFVVVIVVDVALQGRRGAHRGQTLGKQLFGIRVVGTGDAPPSVGRWIGRELARWTLSLISLADSLESFRRASSPPLHDRLFGTTVVAA